MPSTGSEDSRGSVVLGGFLWLRDGGWGFEADPKVDVLSVGDTALDATTPVRVGGEGAVLCLDEPVVVFATGDFGSTETRADLERFGGRYREHGVSQFGFKLVEAGFSETGGDVPDDASDGSANRILLLLGADDPLMNMFVSEKTNRDPI